MWIFTSIMKVNFYEILTKWEISCILFAEVVRMAIATAEQLHKVLKAYNPWWVAGTVNPALTKEYRRVAYYEAMRQLDWKNLRRIVVLTGARRVGKTTILYQMIDALLKQGVPPDRILYVSADHPLLKLSSFQDLLDVYHNYVNESQECWCFFDEIQCTAGWDQCLKTLYDAHPQTRIVATGVANPALVKGSSESGGAEWNFITVPTLSFFEYCSILKAPVQDLPSGLTLENVMAMDDSERSQLMLKLSTVEDRLIRYLRVGSFPELALASDDLYAQQIIWENMVNKVLKRDLQSLYSIRNTTELERIFIYLCIMGSKIVSYTDVSRELGGVARPTVENYVLFLESANLVYISWPAKVGRSVSKPLPKICIADAAIRNAVLMDDDMLADPVELAKMVETAVFRHAVVHYGKHAVGYYLGDRNDGGIDIVVDRPDAGKIFIDAKGQNPAPVRKNAPISKLCGESDRSIVVTLQKEDFSLQMTPERGKLLRIPAFAYLYLLGNEENSKYQRG